MSWCGCLDKCMDNSNDIGKFQKVLRFESSQQPSMTCLNDCMLV